MRYLPRPTRFVVVVSVVALVLGAWRISGAQTYVCGDDNGDGTIGVADVFYLVNMLFAAGPPPTNCPPIGTIDPTTPTQLTGLYQAFDLSLVDPDLATANIRAGVTIFGLAGAPNVVDTSSGNAVAGDIANGKIAWVDGTEVEGVGAALSYPAPVEETGQTRCWDPLDTSAPIDKSRAPVRDKMERRERGWRGRTPASRTTGTVR